MLIQRHNLGSFSARKRKRRKTKPKTAQQYCTTTGSLLFHEQNQHTNDMNTYFPDGDNHTTLNMLVLKEEKKHQEHVTLEVVRLTRADCY